MRLFFKIISSLGLLLCIAVFSLTVFGDISLPDSIVAENGSFNSQNPFFKVSAAVSDGQTLSVNAPKSSHAGTGEAQYELLGIFPVKNVKIIPSDREYVYPGGEPIGIKIYTDGVLVVGTDDVVTGSGSVNPARQSGLEVGDIITEIDGEAITSASFFQKKIAESKNETVRLKIERNGEEKTLDFTLVRSDGGSLRAGLWIRDSFAGIGTMTFYTTDSTVFGALGHAVSDIDTGETVPVKNGEAVGVTIDGCIRGTANSAGELFGSFNGSKLGDLKRNGDTGVFGLLSSAPSERNSVPVATVREVRAGAAQIITTVDSSGPQLFDIRIIRLFPSQKGDMKNMVIEVTDERLISKTGGIVQGMSGSPILQDGRLVGAVTHVFINNPLQGYGIYAENMLESVKQIKKENRITDSAA
jgi:stage IV sporulation protein B